MPGGLLLRWFREVRATYWTPEPAAILRSDPIYSSDSKPKRRKQKEQRRHSFKAAHVTTPPPTRRRTRTNGFFEGPVQQSPAQRVPLARTMMPSRSTPNLQQAEKCYHRAGPRDAESPPPAPPVRDSSTLKSVKYGPGHEKFPSWPVPAAADTPHALRGPPSGGSHRSKSWTDHTNYPKEKVVAYTRPYMKRQHSSYTQQKLKTVMERCEKIPPETYESRYDKLKDRLYISHVDRDGKAFGDSEYTVPSPPERDVSSKPQLTQEDLEEYARSYQEPSKYGYHLTKSGLEEFMEYTRNYEDSLFSSMGSKHQKQQSYAQSEGYHSYVSSTDSTSTPFLDRLRRDSEAAATRPTGPWDEPEREQSVRREGRDSVVTTSSGSASSSETLKWHGSMSDVSVASSSCTHLANASANSRQLIAHSARVQTPQRHHSESVLYMSGEAPDHTWKERAPRTSNSNNNKLKLFPVNTYTVQDSDHHNTLNSSNSSNASNRLSSSSMNAALSVADRISELEKQQKYSYLDPEKKHKVPDPTLKAIQKKALWSFYERHQQHTKSNTQWRSEPHLVQSQLSLPQPPPRVKVQLPSRRASSASDYASGKRSSLASRESKTTDHIAKAKHQYSNSCGSLSSDLLGPIIVGPSISVDDYVPDKPPARPPKTPHLRAAFPDLFGRMPSPDLPPPSPPHVLEGEVIHNNEPLPPPPPECDSDWQREFNERLKENTTSGQFAEGQAAKQTVGLPEQPGVRSSIRTRPGGHIIQQVSSRPYHGMAVKPEQLGFPSQQTYAERSNTKYPAPQKLVLNGHIAVSQKVHGMSNAFRAEPLKPIHKIEAKKKLEAPPPLQPRQARVNQSMRGRVSTPKGPPLREGRSHSLSQSKASYLSSRRDRIVADSETGSYKRTLSPSGHHTTTEPPPEPAPITAPPQRDSLWPKDYIKNTSNLLRRSSISERPAKKPPPEEPKKAIILPDLLLMDSRSQYPHRPEKKASPPSSPVKAPPSPFVPLRPPSQFNPPLLASCINSSYSISLARTSPPSPKRTSPVIKPSLKPLSRSPPSLSSSAASSPLHTSPLGSPKISPKNSPPPSPKRTEDCPMGTEGLQLIQRTEVVLRVNTSTTDASSQTDKEEMPQTPMPTRKKLQEEIDCEKLSEDFVNHLPTSDRLKGLLVPGPDHKKPTDYVYGLFKVEVTSRPRPANSPFRSRSNTPSSSPPPILNTTKLSLGSPTSPLSSLEPSSPLSGSSTYFTISEPKAKFLTRYSQDMNQCHTVKDTKDLTLKKEELVNRLERKLEVLRSEQLVVGEECAVNDELGDSVEAHIRRLARQHEADKFRLHIEEVGKITSLLLGLSGRLARAENALMGLSDEHPEKRILESKRDKLLEQLQEAKKLKECIDRRSVNVSTILYKYLNSDEYMDYDHFINMKAKLLMDAKEIAEKIKLGEEQLLALRETLIVTD